MADEWRRSAGFGEVVARVPPVRPAPRGARRQRTLSRNGCAGLQERSCSHPERIGLERSGEGVSTDAAATAKVTAQEAVLTQSAYAVFFKEHWSDVAGYCASIVGDRGVAEELAQEAFTRLYVRFPLLREPRPYCFRVVSNLARDHLKRSRHEVTYAEVSAVARSVGVDPYLLDAVRRLRPPLMEVVLLHYFADLPLADVATAVRRPVGTVGRQLSEARTALAAALGEVHD